MRVKDAMSPISAIVGPEHTLRQAAMRMVQHRTGAAWCSTTPSPARASSPSATCSAPLRPATTRPPRWSRTA